MDVWILHSEVSGFGFSTKVCEYLNFTPQNYETLGCKLQIPSNVMGWNPNFEISRCKIQSPPNFRGVICNLPYIYIYIYNQRYLTICWLPYIVPHKLWSLHNFPHHYYFLNLIYSLYYLFSKFLKTLHTVKTLCFNCHLPSLSLQSNLIHNEDPENPIALVHYKHNASFPLLNEFKFFCLCFFFLCSPLQFLCNMNYKTDERATF